MNLWPDGKRFRAQLLAWSVRGIACAFPSYFWAAMAGFNHPTAFAGMAAGVASYVVAFAWLTALPLYRDNVETRALGWSLKVAANTRAALAPLMIFGPDMWLGALTLGLMEFVTRRPFLDASPQVHSFGLTYLFTVVQGVLVSITMFLLALIVWALRVWWLARRRNGVAMASTPANVGSDGSL